MKKFVLLIICALLSFPTMAKHHKKSSKSSHHRTHYVRKKIDQSIEHDTLSTPRTLADSIIFEASKHLGKPYRSGNKGPYAFDCSGFTSYVFSQLGIRLGSNSRDQFLQGLKISREHVKKGDLVFFSGRDSRGGVGHVGIVFDVAPDGKSFRFIHAANSIGISIARYPDMGYYSKRLRGFRRIIDGTTPEPLPIDNTFYSSPIPTTNLSLDEPVESNIDLSVSQEDRTHTVEKGENIYTIAKKYHCLSAQLMKWNNLTPSAKLAVGQTLIIKPESKKPEQYLEESKANADALAEEKKNAVAENVIVTVKEGESIFSLSQKYHCTVKEIEDWNKLRGGRLKAGQEIKIRPVSATAKRDTIKNGETVHTVKKGENIYQIARKYNCHVSELKQWNHLTSNIIPAGKEIIIKKTDKGDVHTVRNGETLNSLATKYQCSVADLKKWNHLNSNTIRSGMMLKIKESGDIDNLLPTPVDSDAEGDIASTSSSEENESYTYYTIKSGDTFKRISNKFGCSTNQIMEWNDLTSYVLKPGKRIIVAKGKDATDNVIAENSKVSSTQNSNSKVKVRNEKDDIEVETEKGGNTYYTVKGGDTFRRIANKYGCTTGQIMSWNHLKGYALKPGTQLIVRKGSARHQSSTIAENTTKSSIESTGTLSVETNNVVNESEAEKEHASKTKKETAKVNNSTSSKTIATEQEDQTAENGDTYYTVKTGDTFKRIANKYGCTTGQIMSWNHLKSYALRPGTKLIVKQGHSSETASTSGEVTKKKSTENRTEVNETSATSSEAKSQNTSTGDNDSYIYHYVKSGDTFRRIANQYGCTTGQIMEWNHLNSYALRGNMKLIVGKKKANKSSVKAEKKVESQQESASSTEEENTIYYVKSGDNLSNIAKRNHCTVNQLIKWNNLKNDKLSLGQKLIIKK